MKVNFLNDVISIGHLLHRDENVECSEIFSNYYLKTKGNCFQKDVKHFQVL